MEVEGITGLGARCSLPSCRHLDYLPYKCGHCNRVFCEVHHSAVAHNCEVAARRHVPTCPICEAPVPAGPDGDLNAAMSRHIDQGCPKRPRANPQCAHPACRVRDPAATACRTCGKVFCIKHCVEINHDCPGVPSHKSGSASASGSASGSMMNPFRKAFAANASATPTKSKPVSTTHTSNAKQSQSQAQSKLKLKLQSPPKRPTTTTTTTTATSTSATPSASASVQAGKKKKKMRIAPYANTAATPLSDAKPTSSTDPTDYVSLRVFFNTSSDAAPAPAPAPRYMRFSARTSPGRVVDVCRKLVPGFPAGEGRFATYAVRADLSRVNLLPYVTALRDLSHTIRDGDALVIQPSADGLDPAYLEAMRPLLSPSSSRFFPGTSSSSSGPAPSPTGRKIPKPPTSNNTKCIMA